LANGQICDVYGFYNPPDIANGKTGVGTLIARQTMKKAIKKSTIQTKKILDACCGGRMFWFNKKHPDTLYVDIRKEKHFISRGNKGVDNRHRHILPDKVMDFRKLDLPDNSFSLVVFDPPHLKLGRKSYFAQIYGSLENTWKDDITKGFAECFRVLKEDGVLIFKWSESDILLREILALTPVKPLFGHRSGKAQKTHWVCFMKTT